MEDKPSVFAALRAALADIPTGQDVKAQPVKGNRGKIPYPPAVFPPVPSSCMSEIPVMLELSWMYPACRGVVLTSIPTFAIACGTAEPDL